MQLLMVPKGGFISSIFFLRKTLQIFKKNHQHIKNCGGLIEGAPLTLPIIIFGTHTHSPPLGGWGDHPNHVYHPSYSYR